MIKQNREDENPQIIAWNKAIERLETFSYKNDNETCTLYPDEGEFALIRRVVRMKRRYSNVPSRFGTPYLSRPAHILLEDPSMRVSSTSYFIQLADLVAYASHRAIYPEPWFSEHIWERLGQSRIAGINKYSGGPTGIKLWPPKLKSP